MKFVILLGVIALALAADVPGGWTAQTATDKQYTDLAWNPATAAVNKALGTTNGRQAFVPVKILTVRKQVVAGENIEIKMQMGESTCLRSTTVYKPSTCPPKANGAKKTYTVVILSQPWTNTLKVSSVKAN